MGPGGISIGSLLLILAIVLLLFGTKKLRNLGGDLGGAIKGFKKAMNEDPANKETDTEKKSISNPPQEPGQVYDVKPETEADAGDKPKHS